LGGKTEKRRSISLFERSISLFRGSISLFRRSISLFPLGFFRFFRT
jgi:hypothetical protein